MLSSTLAQAKVILKAPSWCRASCGKKHPVYCKDLKLHCFSMDNCTNCIQIFLHWFPPALINAQLVLAGLHYTFPGRFKTTQTPAHFQQPYPFPASKPCVCRSPLTWWQVTPEAAGWWEPRVDEKAHSGSDISLPMPQRGSCARIWEAAASHNIPGPA